MTRLRQVPFIARDLEPAVQELCAALGSVGAVEVFRDPVVAKFGFHNALIQVGDCFFEIVAPLQGHEESAGSRYLKRYGDGGYMVMLQVDDLTSCEARMGSPIYTNGRSSDMSDREYRSGDLVPAEGISDSHFHPRKFGCLLSLNQQSPPEHWLWAGPYAGWHRGLGYERGSGGFAGVEIACDDPEGMCATWATGMPDLRQVPGRTALLTDDGAELRFRMRRHAREDGVVAVQLWSQDASAVGTTVVVCGVSVTLLAAPSAAAPNPKDSSSDLVVVSKPADLPGVALLEFNRPAKLNAFYSDMYYAMVDALNSMAQDRTVVCVVVTGRGRAFSAGADLDYLVADDQGRDPARPGFEACLRATTSFPKPLIAAVNGVGVGWGFTMLLHCDFVFMSSQAKLRAPFVPLGLTAEAASSLTVATAVGWQNAAHILLSGAFVSAEEALAMGLAFRVSEPTDLLPQALAYAGSLAKLPLPSLITTKRLMLEARRPEASVMAANVREMYAFDKLLGQPENLQAQAAFASQSNSKKSKL